MKRIVLTIMVMITAGMLFAYIGPVTLIGVEFNGEICNVGDGNNSVDVVVRNAPSSAQYVFQNSYIDDLTLENCGTVILKGCRISGTTTIKGSGTVRFTQSETGQLSSVKEIMVQGSANVILEKANLNGDVEKSGPFSGTFEMSDGVLNSGVSFDFSDSGITSFKLKGTGSDESLGTSSSSAVKSINLSGCTDLSSFILGGIFVDTVNLSECTSLTLTDVSEQWDNWKVIGITTSSGNSYTKKGLILSSMNLEGSLEFNNGTIKSLDVSDNKISDLTVVGGGTSNSNLQYVFASDNEITSADIKMSSTTGSYLDLSNNLLGEGDPTKEEDEKVVIINRKDIGKITGYYEKSYPGSLNDYNRLHADYEFVQLTNNTSPPITMVADEYGNPTGSWHCPDCGTSSNAGFSAWEGNSYHVHNCGYDDREAEQEYQVYITYYVMARRNRSLVINGKQITTFYSITGFQKVAVENGAGGSYYDAYLPSGTSLKVNFANEWTGLTLMNVNLRDNDIRYIGGFPYEVRQNGEYQIEYTVGSKKTEDTDYVARFYWEGKHPESTSRWDELSAGLKRDSTFICTYGIQGGKVDEIFTRSGAGWDSDSTSVTFKNYRNQTTKGSTETMYGTIMSIHPFGETNITKVNDDF